MIIVLTERNRYLSGTNKNNIKYQIIKVCISKNFPVEGMGVGAPSRRIRAVHLLSYKGKKRPN
jgi:hypothetical protein